MPDTPQLKDPFADETPGNMLRKMAEKADKHDVDSAVVILLKNDKEAQNYDVSFASSNLTCSETIALLEIQKSRILEYMNAQSEEEPSEFEEDDES